MSSGDIHYLPDNGTGRALRCIELARRWIGRTPVVKVLRLGGDDVQAWDTQHLPEHMLTPVPRELVRYHGGFRLSELPDLHVQANLINEPADLEGSAAD